MKKYLYLNPEDGEAHVSDKAPEDEEQGSRIADGALDVYGFDGTTITRFDEELEESPVEVK